MRSVNILFVAILFIGNFPIRPIHADTQKLPLVTVSPDEENTTSKHYSPSPLEIYSPGFVTIIPVSAAKQSQSRLADVIGHATGLSVRRSGTANNPTAIYMRGAESNQLLLFIDGVPVNNGLTGRPALEDISLVGIEKIEIYRSHLPAQFIGNPIGGAINLVTARKKNSSQTFGSGLGSFYTWYLLHKATIPIVSKNYQHYLSHDIQYEQSKGNFSFLNNNGTYYYNTADDYQDKRKNNSMQMINQHFTWYGRNKKHHFYLTERTQYKQEGIPGRGTIPIVYAQRKITQSSLYGESRHYRFLLNQMNAFFQLGTEIRQETLNDPQNELSLGGEKLQHLTWSGNISSGLVLPLSDHQISLINKTNLTQLQNQLWTTQAQTADIEGSRVENQITLKDEWHIMTIKNSLQINAQAIMHWHIYHSQLFRFSGFLSEPNEEQWKDLYSPQLSLLVEYPEWFAIKSNFQLGYRIPGFFELYGNQGSVIGNPKLKPENSKGFDLGFLWYRWFKWEYVFYYRIIDNMISLIQNSQNSVLYYNFEKSNVSGHELSLKASLISFLHIETNYTYQSAKDISRVPYYRDKNLPFRPTHKWSGQIETIFQTFRFSHKIYANIHYQTGNYLDRYNSYYNYIAAKYELNVGWQVSIKKITCGGCKAEQLTILWEIKNITNEQNQDLLSYPLPGRNFSVSLQLLF